MTVPSDPPRELSWRAKQLLKDVEPDVEAVVADQATVYWNRPARRSEHRHGESLTVAWTIDGVEVAAVTVGPTGPALVAVHDIGLLRPLRHRLRGVRAVVEGPDG